MVVGEHTSNTASQSTIEKTSTTRQPLNRRTKAQRARDAEEEAKRAKKVHKLQALFAGEKRESIPKGFSAFKVSKEAERSSQFSQSSQPSQIKTSAPIDQTSSSFQPSIFGEVPQEPSESPLSETNRLAPYKSLLPAVLGLAFCRVGLLCGTYGNYASSDEGIFTDGAMFVSLIIFAILLIALTRWRKIIPKSAVHMLTRVCIITECLAIVGLTALQLHPSTSDFWRFSLSVICTLAACGVMFYWLRRMRGCASVTAVVYVFSALAVSEVLIYIGTLVPTALEYSLAAFFVLLQFPCQIWARRNEKAFTIEALTPETDYFGFSSNMLANRYFLIANAIGIACMGAVTGFLRGYPDGLPIPFTPVTRAIYGLLVIALSVIVIVLVLQRRKNIMTVGFYLLLEAVACLALIMFSAFPSALDIGSVFSTTLNALMVGFVWYITIAFMSAGWRDPYYYALAGWCVWLGSRSVTRMALLLYYPLAADSLLVCAIMGALIVLSTQVVFVQFLRIRQMITQQKFDEACALAQQEAHEKTALEVPVLPLCPAAAGGACVHGGSSGESGESVGSAASIEEVEEVAAPKEKFLTRLMGLDACNASNSMAEAHQSTLEQSAKAIGNQFMLSEREIEVLALYARGFTQKRVAEELYISPGTAHAHIKRIYAKTGFHSRQEILDYMEEYAS